MPEKIKVEKAKIDLDLKLAVTDVVNAQFKPENEDKEPEETFFTFCQEIIFLLGNKYHWSPRVYIPGWLISREEICQCMYSGWEEEKSAEKTAAEIDKIDDGRSKAYVPPPKPKESSGKS